MNTQFRAGENKALQDAPDEKRYKRAYKSFWYKMIAISFYAVIFGMLAMRIMLPIPTISETENRELKQMPLLSVNNVLFGRFTEDYEDYFADTFPFRDSFMEAGDYVSYLYSIPIQGVDAVIVADQNIMQTDEDFEPVDVPNETDIEGLDEGLNVAGPVMPTPPEPSAGPPDGADSNVSVFGPAEDAQAKGKYFMTDTAIYSQVQIYPDVYTKWAQAVNLVAQDLPGSRVAVMTPPNSYAFYAPEKYYDPECDQKKGIEDTYALLDSRIFAVNPYPYLEADMGEYIYFRTDHHWTARGAYCGYLAFCDKMAIAPQPLNDMEKKVYEKDFLGSYYMKLKTTAKAKLIRNVPDYVEYFVPPEQCQLTTYTNTVFKDGEEIPMFDLGLPSGITNYYKIFLGGDYPCIKITTDTNNGKSILLLKDSYANSFAPFLTANYETIYIVDFRDFNEKKKPSFKVQKFVADNDVDDVLLIINFGFVNDISYVDWYLEAISEVPLS